MSRTFFASAVKQDTNIANDELFGAGWFQLSNAFDVYITNFSTPITYHVMMVVDIWIKPRRPDSHIDELQLTHLSEFIERLIDGSKRDPGHPRTSHGIQRFSRRMRLIIVH